MSVSHEDEWHVGAKCEHNGDAMTKSWVQAVHNSKDHGDFWARVDFTRKLFHAGHHHVHENHFIWRNKVHEAYEVEYDFNEGAKGGISDKNVALRAGWNWQLSDSSEKADRLHYNGEWEYHQEVTHDLSKHWNVGVW